MDTKKAQILQAQNQYYKLILFAGSPVSGTRILHEIGREFRSPVINLGFELAASLFEVPINLRPLKILQLVEDIVSGDEPEIILLDHIEFLFEPSLQQNPLNLLKQLSRNQVILASWRGEFEDGKITFGKQGHPEHKQYNALGIQVFSITNNSRFSI